LHADYNLAMEKIIADFGSERPSLLLHACCAPCSSAVLERVTPFFRVTLYYYNPNIYPEAEFEKRAAEFPKLLDKAGLADSVRFIKAPYDPDAFLAASRGLETAPEGGARCENCFALRLGRTAEEAAKGGYDFFASTLTVSPHKNAAAVNAAGEAAAAARGVRWLPSDFKKKDGYLRSIRLSEAYGLYRQAYCGCAFALRGD